MDNAVDKRCHIDYYQCVNNQIDAKTNTTTTKLTDTSAPNDGCVTCFNALGIGSRMSIYKFLKQHGKSTVSLIVSHIGLTQPTISYHLNEMKNAGILISQRAGKEVYYMINDACPIYKQDCVLKSVKFPK